MELRTSTPDETAHVSDYLSIVWQRKWLCLFVFLVLACSGLFVVMKLLKLSYQARARVSIERLRAPVSEQIGYAGFFAVTGILLDKGARLRVVLAPAPKEEKP